MLDRMQVAAQARICMQTVYRTNACTVREVERTLTYQRSQPFSVSRQPSQTTPSPKPTKHNPHPLSPTPK